MNMKNLHSLNIKQTPKILHYKSIKHNYQLPEAVEVYNESHYIDETIKTNISEYILNVYFSNLGSNGKEKLSILDAGIGGGDLVLLPLLDILNKKNLKFEIVGIDNSVAMISNLDAKLTERNFIRKKNQNKSINEEHIVWKNNNSSYAEVYIYDLEEYSLPNALTGKKFDIILSILTLHHLKNWRLVLSNLIEYLENSGIFVIFEWTKGIKLRDGNFLREDRRIDDFRDIDPTIVNFWKEFYIQRKNYHAWCPEICASDYTMVKEALRKFSSLKEESREFEWMEKANVNWECVKNWIRKSAYSNFYRGLTEKEHQYLIDWVENKIKSIRHNNNWKERLGCKITVFRRESFAQQEKIAEIVQSSLDSTPIYSKLIYEEVKYTNLLQFAVLLIQHDFITDNTLFFTLNKWNMIENTWDKLDKPMIFNKSRDENGEFLKSIVLYYTFVEKFSMSATDIIFRGFRHKPILVIKKNKYNIWTINKYINQLGMIEKLEIEVPCISLKAKFNSNIKNDINQEFYKPIKEDIFHIDFNAQKVKDYIDRMKELISPEFFDSYAQEIEKAKSVLKVALLDKDSPLLDFENFEKFLKILLLNSLIITKWDIAVYIPSISLSPELSLEDNSSLLMSLGGIIIFENNGERENLNKFLEKRIDVLKTVINLKFRSLGIAEYSRKVKHEIKQHALRSAVSAIMARNMSHNIGSHVLARSEVKDIIERLAKFGITILNIDKPNPLNILKSRLDRYIKQKSDFLAEISSEPLATTKSLMFYKEVILPFVKNSQVMDTIAANEGIRYSNNFNNRLKIRVFISNNELIAKFSCMEKTEHQNNPPIYKYPKLNNEKVQEYSYSSTCDSGHELQLVDIENGDKDVEVALPGPLGEFAIYGFLENFIRNSAKHGAKNLGSNENLQIFIQILEDEEKKEFYKIRIWNNITNPDQNRIEEKVCKSLIYVIDAYIKSSIIDDTGKLKRQAWGIAEMKINSLLLYGSTDFSKLSEMLTVQKIQRGRLPVKDGKGDEALVYEFRLMKSKFAYILSTKNIKDSAELVPHGIKVFNSIEDFKEELTESESFTSPKFVILDGSSLNEENEKDLKELEGLKQFMPFRVIIVKKDLSSLFPSSLFPGGCITKDESILDIKNVNDWKEKVWDIWIRHIIKLSCPDKSAKNVCLHIYLNQEWNEEPTKSWSIFAKGFNQKDYCVKIKVWSGTGKSTNSKGQKEFINIGYDRHGGMRQFAIKLDRKVVIDKLSSDFVHLFTQNIKPALPFELTEALLINVAVADDRLAEKSDEKIKIIYEQELWLWGVDSKVYFVSHLNYKTKELPVHPEVKDGLSAGSNRVKCIFNLEESKFEYQSSTVDIQMLIIHQGLIDELNISNEDQEKLLLNIQKNVPFLIVDSGRGIPTTLSDKVKFLPYSLLEQYLIPRISKYCLINTCMSLTRRKEK